IIFGSFYLQPSYNPLESLCELTSLITNSLKESILCCSNFERENEKLKSLADMSVKKAISSRLNSCFYILVCRCPTYALSEVDKSSDKSSLQEDLDDLIPFKNRRKSKPVIGRRN
ncbi:unnamed protein product, partial [Schistosoma margrebowiei]